MKTVIKIGGTLLDDAASRAEMVRQCALLAGGDELVLVHGGGKQLTRYLSEHGVASEFRNGLRVSDNAVIEGAVRVIAGSVNKQLVSELCAANGAVRAIGLSGIDGGLTEATPLDPQLGFVGTPVRSDGKLLRLLVEARYLPVIACVAAGADGQIYNVNADAMAVSCALGFAAERLIFLTDVEGVRGADGTVIRELETAGMQRLIDDGVAAGGMRAKLEAAKAALAGGIREVAIASGHTAKAAEQLLAGAALGTRLRRLPATREASK